jgi:hypothetical protein
MGWATFWAILSKTHLVNLLVGLKDAVQQNATSGSRQKSSE